MRKAYPKTLLAHVLTSRRMNAGGMQNGEPRNNAVVSCRRGCEGGISNTVGEARG